MRAQQRKQFQTRLFEFMQVDSLLQLESSSDKKPMN